MRSKLLGNIRHDGMYQRISPTFERCCASQLFGGARLCCWAPDAVKSRMAFAPIEWMNPSSKCVSFSNLALCSNRSLWRENARQWRDWHPNQKPTLSLCPSSSRTLILASDSSCTPCGGYQTSCAGTDPALAYRVSPSTLFRMFLFEQFVLRFDELYERNQKGNRSRTEFPRTALALLNLSWLSLCCSFSMPTSS